MDWKFYAILSAILFSIGSLLLRYYEKMNSEITPFQLLFGVSVFSFIVVMLLYTIDINKRVEANKIILNKKYLLWIGIYALLFILADYFYYSSHIKTPHIALLFIVLTAGMVIEIIGSHYFFNEKLEKRSGIGILLITLGVLILNNNNRKK